MRPRVRIGMPVAEYTSGAATAPNAAVQGNRAVKFPSDSPLARLSRIGEQVKHDRPAVRAGAVLEDVDALPRAERHAAAARRGSKAGSE